MCKGFKVKKNVAKADKMIKSFKKGFKRGAAVGLNVAASLTAGIIVTTEDIVNNTVNTVRNMVSKDAIDWAESAIDRTCEHKSAFWEGALSVKEYRDLISD